TVNGVTAPLYFVSPSQINLHIPYETGAGGAVPGIQNNGEVASFPFEVAPVAPGVFADQNGSLVPSATGKRGDTLLPFLTGDGDLNPTIATSATPTSDTPVSRLPKPRPAVTVTVGGVKADVAFIGEPSALAGVTQINFVVPDVPAGVQSVVVTAG